MFFSFAYVSLRAAGNYGRLGLYACLHSVEIVCKYVQSVCSRRTRVIQIGVYSIIQIGACNRMDGARGVARRKV